jgi:hypothetical protein
MNKLNFAKVGNKVSVPREHVSTLNDWHKAVKSRLTHNLASVEIDNGRTPYVVDLSADGFGMYPFLECLDIMTEKRGPHGDLIAVDFLNGTLPLEPDTLIFWR